MWNIGMCWWMTASKWRGGKRPSIAASYPAQVVTQYHPHDALLGDQPRRYFVGDVERVIGDKRQVGEVAGEEGQPGKVSDEHEVRPARRHLPQQPLLAGFDDPHRGKADGNARRSRARRRRPRTDVLELAVDGGGGEADL